MDELRQLVRFCRAQGAPEAQAAIMAQQLMKRADQLARERGGPREEVMAYLLRLVVQGRSGEVPAEFQPPAPGPENQNKPDNSAK